MKSATSPSVGRWRRNHAELFQLGSNLATPVRAASPAGVPRWHWLLVVGGGRLAPLPFDVPGVGWRGLAVPAAHAEVVQNRASPKDKRDPVEPHAKCPPQHPERLLQHAESPLDALAPLGQQPVERAPVRWEASAGVRRKELAAVGEGCIADEVVLGRQHAALDSGIEGRELPGKRIVGRTCNI